MQAKSPVVPPRRKIIGLTTLIFVWLSVFNVHVTFNSSINLPPPFILTCCQSIFAVDVRLAYAPFSPVTGIVKSPSQDLMLR